MWLEFVSSIYKQPQKQQQRCIIKTKIKKMGKEKTTEDSDANDKYNRNKIKNKNHSCEQTTC